MALGWVLFVAGSALLLLGAAAGIGLLWLLTR